MWEINPVLAESQWLKSHITLLPVAKHTVDLATCTGKYAL